MSVVSNVILTSFVFPDVKTEEINTIFEDGTTYRQMGFVNLDEADDSERPVYGGAKVLEAEIWVGAFNHLDLDKLIDHLRTLDWSDKWSIQLIVMEQEDDLFRIIKVFPDEHLQEGY